MWSGGRSLRSIAVAGGLFSSLGIAQGQTPLCNGQHPGNPELISGAASCFYNAANGGQTLIRLNESSIIRWDDLRLQQPGSSLTFEWAGQPNPHPAVLNRVELGGRSGSTQIRGALSFNDGNLIITNPNSMVNIQDTMVSARSVVIATHEIDPGSAQQLLAGEGGEFFGSSHPLTVLDGRVVATEGDVVLAAKQVLVSAMGNPAESGSEVLALNASVRVFGGENFRLLPASQNDPRIESFPGGNAGLVSNSKTIRAGRDIELVAENRISNQGFIEANQETGRAFLRVDQQGSIISNTNLISAGFIIPSTPITNSGTLLEPDRGDSPQPVSTGLSRVPVVGLPGEKKNTTTVRIRKSAAITGSASSHRQRINQPGSSSTTKKDGQVARTSRGHLARGVSFFNVRGRTKAKKK